MKVLLHPDKEGDMHKLAELRWRMYQFVTRKLRAWGMKHGYVWPYPDALIEQMREVYYGGIPASILLLCDGMTNGYCYDRAMLMAKVLLSRDEDEDEDGVRLVYASVASLRLNPRYLDRDYSSSDHCVVEVISADGRCLIIDTSSWFVWDKRLYWLMERPRVRMTREKAEIKKFIELDEYHEPENLDESKYWAPVTIPLIERTYGRNTELYSQPGIELLQREVEHYKELIDYDAVWYEVDEDMRMRGFGGLKSFA